MAMEKGVCLLARAFRPLAEIARISISRLNFVIEAPMKRQSTMLLLLLSSERVERSASQSVSQSGSAHLCCACP